MRHALEADDVRRCIKAGKQRTRLALTWMVSIYFVLTERKEGADDEPERFDSDLAPMTMELRRLIDQLVAA